GGAGGGALAAWESGAAAAGNAAMAAWAPTFHSGGFVGASSGPGRLVGAGLFAGAPRFHGGGLLRGEVPIIAKKGEAVFTPEQMNNADRILHSALNTANNGTTIQQSVTVNGEGGAGTPDQNADLAGRIGRQVKEELRGMMLNEM